MSDAKSERNAIEDHEKNAVFTTGVAMVLTVATIIGVLADQPDDPLKRGTFTLLPPGQKTLGAACEKPVETLDGRVDPSTLKGKFMPVTVDAGDCADDEVVLRVRSRDIAAVVVFP
jgi:hypothetical protein